MQFQTNVFERKPGGLEALLRRSPVLLPICYIHTLHPLSDGKMKKDKHCDALGNSLVLNAWKLLPS